MRTWALLFFIPWVLSLFDQWVKRRGVLWKYHQPMPAYRVVTWGQQETGHVWFSQTPDGRPLIPETISYFAFRTPFVHWTHFDYGARWGWGQQHWLWRRGFGWVDYHVEIFKGAE